jgi:hypothetical protein
LHGAVDIGRMFPASGTANEETILGLTARGSTVMRLLEECKTSQVLTRLRHCQSRERPASASPGLFWRRCWFGTVRSSGWSSECDSPKPLVTAPCCSCYCRKTAKQRGRTALYFYCYAKPHPCFLKYSCCVHGESGHPGVHKLRRMLRVQDNKLPGFVAAKVIIRASIAFAVQFSRPSPFPNLSSLLLRTW